MYTYSSQYLSYITSLSRKWLLNHTYIKQDRRLNQHRDANFPPRRSEDWRPEAYGKMPSLEREWVWKCALGEHRENARTRSEMWIIRESEEFDLWNGELDSKPSSGEHFRRLLADEHRRKLNGQRCNSLHYEKHISKNLFLSCWNLWTLSEYYCF